jgi:hypothetical protein
MKALEAIEGAIDRLSHLGVAIRQSSVTSQITRVKRLEETAASNVFKDLSHMSLRILYPAANPDLHEQLSRSMVRRYAQIISQKNRQNALKTRRSKPPSSLSTIAEDMETDNQTEGSGPGIPKITKQQWDESRGIVNTRLFRQPAPSLYSDLSSLNTKMLGNKLSDSQKAISHRSKTSSIRISQVNYPNPPQGITGRNHVTCDWCFELTREASSKGIVGGMWPFSIISRLILFQNFLTDDQHTGDMLTKI